MNNSDREFECPPKLPLYPDLSKAQQTVLVLLVFAFMGALTVALLELYKFIETKKSLRWWPSLVKTWPLLGLTAYVPLAIYCHFIYGVEHTCIVPPYGTWGWWYVPFSHRFHVIWTGYVGIIGGVALALSGMLDGKYFWARPVRKASALCLLVFTIGMTFANVYILTHGAWCYEQEKPFSLGLHFVRISVQALWLSNLAYMASHETLGGHAKVE